MGKNVWQSDDGKLFDTEEECLRHERASLFWTDLNNGEQYAKNEERWEMQTNFSRYFLEGFQSTDNFWSYAKSFRTLSDILDGKRPDLPKTETSEVKALETKARSRRSKNKV